MRTAEEKARSRCRKVTILSAFVAIGIAIAFIYIVTRPQRVELSQGTTLALLGVTLGTERFETGTVLERLLGDRIPAGGLEIAGWRLRRPEVLRSQDAPMTAWVMMEGSIAPASRFYSSGSRVIAANTAGRALENPWARLHPLGSTNQILFEIPLFAFPRDERHLRLRLSPSKADWEERRWVEFRLKNPLRRKAARWEPGRVPMTNQVEESEFVLAGVVFEPTRIRFRVPRGWRLTQCKIEDEEGNSYKNISRPFRDAHGGVRALFAHSLERDRTWKITAKLIGPVLNSSWADSTLESGAFHSGQDLTINIAEGSELTVTNTVGAAYRCRFDEQTLSIRGAEKGQERTRFTILKATDQTGRDVEFLDISTSQNPRLQRLGAQSWRTDERVERICVRAVVPKIVETAFYIRPAEAAQ